MIGIDEYFSVDNYVASVGAVCQFPVRICDMYVVDEHVYFL